MGLTVRVQRPCWVIVVDMRRFVGPQKCGAPKKENFGGVGPRKRVCGDSLYAAAARGRLQQSVEMASCWSLNRFVRIGEGGERRQ
jgi:hypothetical protein